MKIDGECLIELIRSCRNKVQISRSVRMPQLHTSLHFHLTPIVILNGSSRRDLILDSQYFCRSVPAGAENPPLLSSSNWCSMPPSKNESILHEKGLLSITRADRDETSPLRLECKQDKTSGKSMNALHKDEGQLSNSKLQDQLKSSWTPLTFTSTLEGNASTVLKSQTSRSSYAYDSSISSIDDASIDNYLNKNHLMSVRTFRLQRPSKLVSNILKEGEEDNVQAEHQLNKIPPKSRTNSSEIADEGNVYTNRKLQCVSHNLAGHMNRASAESLPLSSQVEFEMNQESHLMEQNFISNSLRNQKQDRIELSSNMYDIRKSQIGQGQWSPHPSHSFCCHGSLCSSCVYSSHHSSLIEEVRKLKMKDKRLPARRQCRPVSNGAPFVICSQCFELLRLPMDLFISKKGSNKIQCGACSKISVLQFPAKDGSTSNNSADAKSCTQVLQSSHSASNISLTRNSSQVENCEEELLPTLHQLMGYYSATEVLYQITDVDEGYESSEPAMPNSYRRYEEEKHKKLLLQCSEDETCYDCVEVEEVDSSKIVNKREQSRLRSLINGVMRIESWGSKA